MRELKPASIAIIAMSAVTIGLLSVIGMGKLGDVLFQASAQSFGPLPGNGLLQASGLLEGTGLLQSNAPLHGPLLGPRPPLDGGPAGVGGSIVGASEPPPASVHLASLPPNALLTGPRPATQYVALWPPSLPSAPTPSDPGPPPAQPASACVTCFIPPPPFQPIPPANNIVNCANVTCN